MPNVFRLGRLSILAALIPLIAVAAVAGPALGADLTVRVDGLRSRDGLIHFGLYGEAGADDFPDASALLGGGRIPAHREPPVYVFRGLAPGKYAVSMFHDENGDGKFDTTWLGMPEEGYGFSNDVMGFLSAPSFAAASVTLGTNNKTVTITVKYLTFW